MRIDLDVDRYFRFPLEVRQRFDDWAMSEGIDLGKLLVRAVRLGEGRLECERWSEPLDGETAEWWSYPVKTLPPLEMFNPLYFDGTSEP